MKIKDSRVAIIVLTLNSLDLTKEFLRNISSLNTKNIDCLCVVVDNGSNDGTKNVFKNYKLPNMEYVFLESKTNLGYAGGNNIGIKYAMDNKFDYILIMNNDLILPKSLLVQLTKYMQQNEDVGICSPKIYFAKGYEFHKDRYTEKEKGRVIWYAGGIVHSGNVYTSHRGVDEIDKSQYEKVTQTDVASGACMMVRKTVFQKIGLFDEDYFLYWEDADFSKRAKNMGFKVVYFPGAYVWHKVSVTSGGSGSSANDYFLTRNRFFYALKYSALRTKIAVIKDTFKLMFVGRHWQKKAAVDALLGKKGIGSYKISNGK